MLYSQGTRFIRLQEFAKGGMSFIRIEPLIIFDCGGV